MADPTGTEKNYVVKIGADLVITHTVVDDLSVAVDLTGATFKALVKNSLDDTDAEKVATFTCATVTPSAGTMKLTLPDTETAKLTDGNLYYYDLHVTLSATHASYPSFDDVPLWGELRAMRPATRASA